MLFTDKENRGNRFDGKRVLDARKAQETRGDFGERRGGGGGGGERGQRRVSESMPDKKKKKLQGLTTGFFFRLHTGHL